MGRSFAPPQSISAQARAALMAMQDIPSEPYPDADDDAGWRAYIARSNQGMEMFVAPMRARLKDVTAEPCTLDGVDAFRLQVTQAQDAARIVFDIHGGALIVGGGELCRVTGMRSAAMLGANGYTVDYRMPPDHPYPAALDDCVRAYRAVLRDHAAKDILVVGASAGGNLAAATMLRARDEGLPLPAGLILITPEVDLTESGDSFRTNLGVDPVLKFPLIQANLLYAAGHDLAHPYLSPLFGDFTADFPPTLITSGTRDLFLSNCVRLDNALRRAGRHSQLIVEEAMPHGGFMGSPEDEALERDMRAFAERAWRGEFIL